MNVVPGCRVALRNDGLALVIGRNIYDNSRVKAAPAGSQGLVIGVQHSVEFDVDIERPRTKIMCQLLLDDGQLMAIESNRFASVWWPDTLIEGASELLGRVR